MHVKVFCGTPGQVEAQVEEWLRKNKRIAVCDRLQSQSEGDRVEVVITITIFYDE